MKTVKWPLQDAKNKFSEVVRLAKEQGPQTVTKHGKDSVVILSIEDYELLDNPNEDLIDFFQTAPILDKELNIERDRTPSREIEL